MEKCHRHDLEEDEMSKLTPAQMSVLKLANRSPKDEEGWSKCAPAVFKQLISLVPVELIERRQTEAGAFVRLTAEAQGILRWMG